jgi:hypothetical protein
MRWAITNHHTTVATIDHGSVDRLPCHPGPAPSEAFVLFTASDASTILAADVERSDIEADHIGILVTEHHALVYRFRHAFITARKPKRIGSNASQKFVRLRRVSLEGEPMDIDDSPTVGADVDQLGVIVERLGQVGLALQDLHVFGNIRHRDLVRGVARVEFLKQREAAQLAQSQGAGGRHDHEPYNGNRDFPSNSHASLALP